MIRIAVAAIALGLSASQALAQPSAFPPDRLGPRETDRQRGTNLRQTERLERVVLATSASREALATLPLQPVDDRAFALARERIGQRLESLRRAGALAGSRPEHAWYVRCDASTTAQALRRLGRLACMIGVAVERPGEFRVLRVERGGFPRP